MSQTEPLGGFVADRAPSPEPDDADDPGTLAMALDSVIDAATTAFDQGDLPTVGALLDAADATSDKLLDSLGVGDPL